MISFRQFLKESSIYGYFVSRHGEVPEVSDWGGHNAVAKDKLGDDTQETHATSVLMNRGWMRVATSSASIYADTRPQVYSTQSLPSEQRKFLNRLKDESDRNIVLNGEVLEESFGLFAQFWLDSSGNFIKVDDHKQWVADNIETSLTHDSRNDTWTLRGREVSPYRIADARGYVRVIRNSDVVGFSYFKKPSSLQIDALRDFAEKSDKKLYDYEKEEYL